VLRDFIGERRIADNRYIGTDVRDGEEILDRIERVSAIDDVTSPRAVTGSARCLDDMPTACKWIVYEPGKSFGVE
jgi:hypothetical protein